LICRKFPQQQGVLPMVHAASSPVSGPASGGKPDSPALALAAIGAGTAAAHIGNNFTTYLVGGLIDTYGFSASAMGLFAMLETLSYGAAMLAVARWASGDGSRRAPLRGWRACWWWARKGSRVLAGCCRCSCWAGWRQGSALA
jgi:hypothetical protein